MTLMYTSLHIRFASSELWIYRRLCLVSYIVDVDLLFEKFGYPKVILGPERCQNRILTGVLDSNNQLSKKKINIILKIFKPFDSDGVGRLYKGKWILI